MNHQPFETWILNDEPLDRQQQSELEQHLRDCQSCKTLQDSWETAKHTIKSAPEKRPSPGFSMRWQASLKERHEAEARNQSRTILIWISCIVIITILTFVVVAMPDLSIISMLASFLTTLFTITYSIQSIVAFVEGIAQSLSPTAQLLAGISLSTVISVFAFVWGISIWRISRKGVRQYEED